MHSIKYHRDQCTKAAIPDSAVLLPQLQNFSHAQEKIFAPLLPQEQNVSHQPKVLLFCNHKKKKHSATVVAEAFGNWGSRTPDNFSGEKHSAIVGAE